VVIVLVWLKLMTHHHMAQFGSVDSPSIDPSQVTFIVSIAEYRKTAKLHNTKLCNKIHITKLCKTSPRLNTQKKKRRTSLLIQSIDNLTENTELKM